MRDCMMSQTEEEAIRVLVIKQLKNELKDMLTSGNKNIEDYYRFFIKYKEQGIQKRDLYSAVDSLRAELKEYEDLLLEFMDMIVGFINPKYRIY